jgi:transcriptional regulator with XRE-family HTH domain
VQPQEWLTRPGGLAQRLRQLRATAGLTGEQLAAQAGWDRYRVSKLENGRQMPSDNDITTWAQVTGQPGEAPGLLAMLAEGRAIHREWKHQARTGQAAVQADFDALVHEAARVRNFQIMVVPGLLQTPLYARSACLQVVRLVGTDPDKVDEAVSIRMARQRVLYEPGRTFDFVFTQAALDYPLCPRDVMAGQIDRLISVIGMPNVTFGIVPSGVELAITPQVGFLMVDDTTVVETFTSMDTLTGDESARYGEIFDLLQAQAVTGDEARRLLTAAAVRLAR